MGKLKTQNSQFRFRETTRLPIYGDTRRNLDVSLQRNSDQIRPTCSRKHDKVVRTGTELHRDIDHPWNCGNEDGVVEEELGCAPSRRMWFAWGTSSRGYVDGKTDYATTTWRCLRVCFSCDDLKLRRRTLWWHLENKIARTHGQRCDMGVASGLCVT